jgi:hypothetical protein
MTLMGFTFVFEGVTNLIKHSQNSAQFLLHKLVFARPEVPIAVGVKVRRGNLEAP